MEEFIFFHDFTNIILIFIITFVGRIMVRMLFNNIIFKGLLPGQVIECIWTTIPALILIQIALPSLSLLYLIGDLPPPKKNLTIKAIGHQWYWKPEYTDFWVDIDVFTFDDCQLDTGYGTGDL